MEANLAVDFLVYPLLPLMDGSDMLCHVTLDIDIKHGLQGDDQYLSGEHFVAVGAGDALDPAVLGLPHVDVADVRAEVGLGAEYPHTEVTPLVDWATRRAPALGHGTQLPSQGRGHTLLLLRISSLYFGCVILCIFYTLTSLMCTGVKSMPLSVMLLLTMSCSWLMKVVAGARRPGAPGMPGGRETSSGGRRVQC